MAVVRMWLARKQLFSQRREAEKKIASEKKRAMEAKFSEERRIAEETESKQDFTTNGKDALPNVEGDGDLECVKEVATPEPAVFAQVS